MRIKTKAKICKCNL